MRWVAILLGSGAGACEPEERAITRRKAGQAFTGYMQAAWHPGRVLIVTDAPLSPDNRTGQGVEFDWAGQSQQVVD